MYWRRLGKVRIRALKPGFFKNEDLCALSAWHRLCFEGLWCCADREGRMADRPKRLKVEIFPYDDLNMDTLMWDLATAGFIVRYAIATRPLVWIPTFAAHQHPRQDEAASELPAFVPGSQRNCGPDPSTFPAFRPIETDPSLHSGASVTPARIVTGDLDLGTSNWELGTGTSGLAPEPPAPSVRAQDLIDLWNATTTPPIPRCRELPDSRRRKIRARLASRPSMTEWREIFEAIEASDFYRGGGERSWIVDFDWIIKNDGNPLKVLEKHRTPAGWRRPEAGKQTTRLAAAVANIAREG